MKTKYIGNTGYKIVHGYIHMTQRFVDEFPFPGNGAMFTIFRQTFNLT